LKKGIAGTGKAGKSKQAARQGLGRTGEHLAAEALTSTGYHILERNFRCRHGEIDLVAEDEHDLVFVEVKARRGTSYGRPEDALTFYKRRNRAIASKFTSGTGAGSVVVRGYATPEN
jgi:putative endonuclease